MSEKGFHYKNCLILKHINKSKIDSFYTIENEIFNQNVVGNTSSYYCDYKDSILLHLDDYYKTTNKTYKVCEIILFYPHGYLKKNIEKNSRKGIGQKILSQCIEDSIKEKAKVIGIQTESKSLTNLLLKNDFIKINDEFYKLNVFK